MRIFITKPAEKQLKKLPLEIKRKAYKQFLLLQENTRHPSLRFKKMSGQEVFEARIDRHYRLTGELIGEDFYIIFLGPHDEGLGKK